MNYQFKGFQFSFIIHAVIFLSIIGISRSIVTVSKAIVIDFNIENPMYSSRESPSAPSPKTGVKPHKPEVREQKSEPIKTEQKIEPQVVSTTPLPISDAQVEVPASLPSQHNEYKSEGQTTAGLSKSTASSGSGVNAKTDVNTASAGSGSSEGKLKTKYLKEHFTYIRDTIMKNLSYPQMARKMGWEGKVIISFIICENGHAENIKIKESSGFGVLDKNAVETIKRVLPFPKPPVRAELIMPIVYRLE